jgi:hypothetical protein
VEAADQQVHGKRHKGMTSAEREHMRRNAICAVLQKTDRILLGDVDLAVQHRDNPDMPPGWTTGTEIVVNMHAIPSVTDEDLVALWGLNYHELAHVMLTPRIKGKFRDLVREHEFRVAMNLAEDWRIETQFASLFEAADRYFKCTFKKLVIDGNDETKAMTYPLAVGRVYLATTDRERYRRRFVQEHAGKTPRDSFNEEQIQQIEGGPNAHLLDLDAEAWSLALRDLAHRYVSVSWSRDDREHNQKLIGIIEQIKILVPWETSKDADNHGMPVAGNESGVYGPDLPSSGQTSPELESDAAEAAMRVVARSEEEAERIAEMLEEIENASLSDAPDDGAGSAPDGTDGDTTSAQGEGASGESRVGGAPQDHNEVIVDPNQSISTSGGGGSVGGSTVSGGASAGGYTGEAVRTAQLSDEQRQLIDRMFSNDEQYDALLSDEVRDEMEGRAIKRDLQSMRRAVSEALGEGMHLRPEDNGSLMVAPSDVRVERNRLARELKQLRASLEGTYVNEQPSGKVHVRSWINASPAQRTSAFRSWLPDELDAAGTEVVGLIDRSGSMSGVSDHASQVTWALASAIQEADGHVTVIGFADPGKDEVLIGRETRMDKHRYASYGTYGGTTIAPALVKARQVLVASPMPNRLLYIVTDGGWSDMPQAADELRKINAAGIDTVLVLLGMHLERETRGCRHVVQANDVSQMGHELQKIVRRINRDVVRRVASERGLMV